MKRREGFIQVKGGKVWYEIVGESNKTPLIGLHGGPGYPSDSMEPLLDLAGDRKVILYDQLGCGNSQRISDKSLWTVKHYVEELHQIIKFLKLKNYHILGQSWGSGLAAAFALTKPKGLKSLILSNPYLSTPVWEKDAERLLSTMPKSMQKALKKGDQKSKAYKEAVKEYYYRFIWRRHDRPVAAIRATNKMSHEIYNYMWGPEEFSATGTLKNFDLSKELREIKVPVLFLCGRFDEATPEATEYFKSLIPGSKMKVFEKSAHMTEWTEREEYIKTVRDFLNSLE